MTFQILNEATNAVFGDGTTLEQVEALNPELASTFRANLPPNPGALTGEERFSYTTKMRNLVRDRVYRVAQTTDGADLLAAMKLRLAYLVAARKVNPAACLNLYRLAALHEDAWLGEETIAEEQALALKLLQDGRLVVPGPRAPGRATIPGWMIGGVIAETGLSEHAVRDAMDRKGSDAALCAVNIALLRKALDTRGPERTSILHVL